MKLKIVSFLCAILFFLSCSNDNQSLVGANDLELIDSFELNISEPSGLGINLDGTALYTVSDNKNRIYKISAKGSILKTYDYVGNDLEGVSVISNTSLLIAEERTKEVVEIDLISNSVVKHKIDYENSDDNSGIEGIAYNNNNGNCYILNEKDPGLLIELLPDFSIKSIVELKFTADNSGIFYDDDDNLLWILSDQDKTLNKCKLNGELIKEYTIQITKAEGIAVSKDKVYIVSDSDEKLFVFKKPLE